MMRVTPELNEKIVESYPWYSLGYLYLYRELQKEEPESATLFLKRIASKFYSRAMLYPKPDRPLSSDKRKSVGMEREIESEGIKLEEIEQEKIEPEKIEQEEIELEEMIDFVPEITPQILLVGGDYFSRKDFQEIELDKSEAVDHFIAERPTLLRSFVKGEKRVEDFEKIEVESGEKFDDELFYTESLAAIYAQQGFYKRAIEVYGKLILLYPEKSSYFASLIEEIKDKHKA